MIFIILALLLLGVCDVYAYLRAKYPERARHWGYKMPGGGFVALLRFGPDR